MINSLEITSLFGIKGNDVKLRFDADFNLITGQNGSGKTTILKVLWYMLSGKYEQLLKEVNFKKIAFNTNFSSIEVMPLVSIFGKSHQLKVEDKKTGRQFLVDPTTKIVSAGKGKSLFFPTFRRLEGGFSNDKELSMVLNNFSNELSSLTHQFIAYVSTSDVDNLLNAEKAKVSEVIQGKEAIINAKLKELLKNRKNEEALAILQAQEEETAKKNAKFDALEQLTDVYLEKRISLTGGLKIGKNERLPLVKSQNLSAGEKQFFAFLAYNAFSENTVIFIDEPELSLHPDWQRVLLKLLKSQNTTNQFIMATHSPFIYANYPEKEIELNTKKGNEL